MHNLNEEQTQYLNSIDFLQGEKCYENKLPWICKDAILFILDKIKKTDKCLEFGSGGSTLFFKERIMHVNTYEADKNWYNLLQKHKCEKIKFNFCKRQKDLIEIINRLKNNEYDICMVDIGSKLKKRSREQIFFKSIPKMKKNAIYILDNALSKKHYPNIYNWSLKDFQKVVGNHYTMVDFNDTCEKYKYASTKILLPK